MTNYVFGPVPSRRLGRSLGVDLVPFKTCSYDCVYCQLGRTTCRTTERKEWVPLEDVLGDLEARLPTKPDYITLAGSGEPTLYSRLGELIAGIKAMTDVPVAVLTNGSLFADAEVRAALMQADLVVPSLDAGNAHDFAEANRPHPRIDFDAMVEGLCAFRREFTGQYHLEVLLLGGVTSSRDKVEQIARVARRIDPDRIQLNTVTRPPAESSAMALTKQEMEALAPLFGDKTEIIADFRGPQTAKDSPARPSDVLDVLRRRPCTVEDIADGMGLPREEVLEHIKALESQHLIDTDRRATGTYYTWSGRDSAAD